MEPIVIQPHDGPQREFLSSCADIAIFGGAAGGGKSFCLLLDAVRYCIGDQALRDYGALLLRKTFSQIEQQGGLKDASERWYVPMGGKFLQTQMEWRFPSGASIKFGHLEHENDKQKYQGAEVPWIGFDELTHFSESSFFFLMSRNRSTCPIPSRIRATCNPDAGSWVADLISWWIDPETGYPLPERSGVIRWFIRSDNQMIWSDTREELIEKYPMYDDEGNNVCDPKSLTFIGAKLTDNPTLMKTDPGYRASLAAMPRVDRERLLDGNWLVTSTAGAEWEEYPHYFDKHLWVDAWPDDFISSCLVIDPSKGRTDNSDFSAIVFVGLKGGKMWVRSSIKKRPPEQIVRDAVDMYVELKPAAFGMESNAFQDLFVPVFNQECERRNIPGIPIQLYYNNTNKKIRIKSLGMHLEAQRLLLHKSCESNKLLYSQLKDFGVAKHDDGPDALECAIRLLYELGVDVQDEHSYAIPEDDIPDIEFAL